MHVKVGSLLVMVDSLLGDSAARRRLQSSYPQSTVYYFPQHFVDRCFSPSCGMTLTEQHPPTFLGCATAKD